MKKSNFSDWDSQHWIHYSNKSFLSLNPQPLHIDLVGIYLFPESFKPAGGWSRYFYKFTVKIPSNLKILDFSTISREEALDIADLAREISDEYENYILNGDYDRYLRSMWESTTLA